VRLSIRLIVIYGLILHTAMFAYDIANPGRFLKADRALERRETIEGLSAVISQHGNIVDYLATHGIVGDYFIQALAYIPLGQYGLIVFQIALLLASIAALYKLTQLVSGSKTTAAIASLVYMHLPQALVFTHQLASEAVCVPLIVVSFYYLARYWLEQRSITFLIMSGILFGIAILVRPVLTLWPIAAMLPLLLVPGAQRVPRASAYTLAASSPLLLWMLFILAATGTFSMGSSSHDLSHNLYKRTQFVLASLSPEERANVERRYLAGADDSRNELGLGTYLHLVAAEPGVFGIHLVRDAVVFVGKSAVNRLILDYFNVFPAAGSELQDPSTGWRRHWEEHGLWHTIIYMLSRSPLLILVNAAATVACLAFMGMALVGAALLISQLHKVNTGERVVRLLILAFPLYIFFASQVVSAMQSRHRAPAEFALCLLFAVSTHHLISRSSRRHAVHAPIRTAQSTGALAD
jgi:4-amino-4-deoxy-L-arabinose transferase-like glycosyltransferase